MKKNLNLKKKFPSKKFEEKNIPRNESLKNQFQNRDFPYNGILLFRADSGFDTIVLCDVLKDVVSTSTGSAGFIYLLCMTSSVSKK